MMLEQQREDSKHGEGRAAFEDFVFRVFARAFRRDEAHRLKSCRADLGPFHTGSDIAAVSLYR